LFENINADEIITGNNVVIEPSARITGMNGKAKKIVIGDNVYIGSDVQIICDEFTILDYSKVHHHTNFHGSKPLQIGYNCWIGQYSIIDSIGGTTIGNNCGIGAHSQLWSHIMFGDTMEGCLFKSEAPLQIGNDVWFVGHCIVSPVIAEDKSMALAGSVVTKDMKYNEIYAGTPAKSVSSKIGHQFIPVSTEEKFVKMKAYLNEWGGDKNKIKITTSHKNSSMGSDISYFNVCERTYTKKQTPEEISFMKFLLPYRAKFIPHR
jgi:acetyltransferase-like isoleucine patch superfamily enzyme